MTERDIELMFEELIASEITRRRLLRQAGAGALGLSLAGLPRRLRRTTVAAAARRTTP